MAQGVGPKLPIEKKVTYMTIQDMIAQGKSRQSIIKYLTDQGTNISTANKLYYEALKDIQPDPNLLDDYKKGMIQQNLDRLEKIIDDCIDKESYQNKQVAIKAIAEINKMLGLSEGNNVTIAQNKDGDQIINIRFD